MTKVQSLSLIDLFCGCGGFSLGANLAGFKVKLSVDIDTTLSSAYKLNFPRTKLLNLDLSKVTGRELMKHSNIDKVFGVIGGPPCQGFSSMGRRNEQDPRNELIGHYFKQIKEIQPSFFIMENVPGVLFGPMRRKLEDQLSILQHDYTIAGPVILNAADLGAATNRKRVIIVGYKDSIFENFSANDHQQLRASFIPTVEDAISDLPSPLFSNQEDFCWGEYKLKQPHSEYAAKARKLPTANIGAPSARKKLLEGLVSGVMDTVHSPKVSERYKLLQPGKSDPTSKSPKLKWDGLAPTLRAGTGNDRGSYQAVRPIHPEEGRVITVREAARLQGFPDWYQFHHTKWHSFRMIGNSVSPYLSYEILNFIKSKIKS